MRSWIGRISSFGSVVIDRESLPNMTQVDFSAMLDLLLSEIERISRG
jgi:hypothetical protein